MICMSTVAVRVDDQLKDDATKLFQSLGLDMSTAVKIFSFNLLKLKVYLLRLKIILQF